ncbi:MAG: ankyrin repeat domain-containing protein [Paracoccaceae bacterium]
MRKIDLQGALNLAAKSGDVGFIKQFYAAGADINKETGGLTPLLAAMNSDHFDAVRETILLGADVKANNEAVLRTAISRQQPEILELVLRVRTRSPFIART